MGSPGTLPVAVGTFQTPPSACERGGESRTWRRGPYRTEIVSRAHFFARGHLLSCLIVLQRRFFISTSLGMPPAHESVRLPSRAIDSGPLQSARKFESVHPSTFRRWFSYLLTPRTLVLLAFPSPRPPLASPSPSTTLLWLRATFSERSLRSNVSHAVRPDHPLPSCDGDLGHSIEYRV